MFDFVEFLYKGNSITPIMLTWYTGFNYYTDSQGRCVLTYHSADKTLDAIANFVHFGIKNGEVAEINNLWTGNSIIYSISCSVEFVKLLSYHHYGVFYPKNNKKFYHHLKSSHKYLK